ncbi:MAG: hypothetical protein IJV55_08050 [Paludibacteraceae bacterium]|nr:hypothetical protein [Paludibacteraceae bacterium]
MEALAVIVITLAFVAVSAIKSVRKSRKAALRAASRHQEEAEDASSGREEQPMQTAKPRRRTSLCEEGQASVKSVGQEDEDLQTEEEGSGQLPDLTDPDEARRAVIAAEIMERKY